MPVQLLLNINETFFKKMRRQIPRKLDWLKIYQLDITEDSSIDYSRKMRVYWQNWVQFLNFTVHIRHYCNSSYVNWQIQFSITFSKFQKYWHCFYSFFKCFFSFYFHQATFRFHKMFHYPNFHDISPFSTSIPIL